MSFCQRIVAASLAAFTAVAVSAAAVSSFSAGMTASAASEPILTCTTADEWDALFDRRNQSSRTWLGADGIFTVSLDGNDAFASASGDTTTFFIFSDTLMGTSNADGKVSQWAMPNHTSALLSGSEPDKDNFRFVYGDKGNMQVGSNLFGNRNWMLDCFVVGNKLYILGFPQKDWKPTQIDMVEVPIVNGLPDYSSYSATQKISQLWYRTSDDRYLYAYGVGVTMNTVSAGAPDPDGYIYIYGYRDAMKEWSRKDMIVARIKESDFPDFSKVRYWNGSSWDTNIANSAPVLQSVSCELSVSPVTVGPYKGKYIAVYTEFTESSNICYAIGDSPVGPFDDPVTFYVTPEHGQTSADGRGTLYTYNAKAHPHLSSGDKLLVSYNCNVHGDEQYSVDYHPRFLWLDLDPLDQGDGASSDGVSSEGSGSVSSGGLGSVSSENSSNLPEVSSAVSESAPSDITVSDGIPSDTVSDSVPDVSGGGPSGTSSAGSGSAAGEVSSQGDGDPREGNPGVWWWLLAIPAAAAIAAGTWFVVRKRKSS